MNYKLVWGHRRRARVISSREFQPTWSIISSLQSPDGTSSVTWVKVHFWEVIHTDF